MLGIPLTFFRSDHKINRYYAEPQSSLAKKTGGKEQLTLFSYLFWVPSDLGFVATRWQSCAG